MKIRLRDGTGTRTYHFVVEDWDRHGNVRVYLRRHGRKVRLRETPGTDDFEAEYRKALEGGGAAAPARAPAARTSLRWLVQEYFKSAEFIALGDSTRRARRGILDKICRRHGDKPFARMEAAHVQIKIRDAKAKFPAAANARVMALRQVFAWAVTAGHADSNPARDVPLLGANNPEGVHAWTIDEIRQFENRHPIGTKARLALALFLFTGVRRSDAIKLGPQMENEGVLRFTETKGRARKPKKRELPILPELRAVLDATPSGHLNYLVTEFGKPFTATGFGNWFRKRCDEAGLPQCSAHGLRKAAATIAADNGATEHQLMAIFGWDSPKMAALYTREADRKRLASEAMHLLMPSQTENESVPLSRVVAVSGTKGGK